MLANVERAYAIQRRRGRIANKGIESLLVCVCRCGSGEVPKLRLRAQGEAMMTVLSEEAILDERYGS